MVYYSFRQKGKQMIEFFAGFICCLLLIALVEVVHYRRRRAMLEWLDGKRKIS